MDNAPLVNAYVDTVHGGDTQAAVMAVNAAAGTRYNRYRLTEWRRNITPLPARIREIMRDAVIGHYFEPDVAHMLRDLLAIERQ